MHILYYHQYFISRDGSGGTRSYENARGLVAAGHKVTMVCGDGASGLSSDYKKGIRSGLVDGIHVIQLDTKYSNYQSLFRRTLSFFMFSIRSSKLVFTLDYDVIFATSTPLTIGIPGIIAKLFRRKYFVFEVRDLWPELPKAMGLIRNPIILFLMSVLEYCTYKSADRLIGLSGGMVEGIVKRGIKRESVALIPNGCDLGLFKGEKQSLRNKRLSANDFVAIYAGAHGVANGLEAILDIASYLKNINEKEIKFLFIGDGKCKNELIKVSEEKELYNCVFIPSMSKKDVVGLLRSADIGLQILKNIPAFYKGTSPNKFYDYLASGLPIIVNYPGDVADLITSNNLGCVIPPGRPDLFGDALVALKNDPSLLKEMGVNAKKLAAEQFDREKTVKKWVTWVTEEVVNE